MSKDHNRNRRELVKLDGYALSHRTRSESYTEKIIL